MNLRRLLPHCHRERGSACWASFAHSCTFVLVLLAPNDCPQIAAFIKKEFDRKYSPTWHCIVGRNFGSYVTHETKHFIYFYLGQVAILLFKSG
jgi:hypothetical protein